MSEKQETMADIVAEMKGFGRRHWMHDEGQNIRVFAERIEAAYKGEFGNGAKMREANVQSDVQKNGHNLDNSTTGNAAKMREALEFLIKHKEWLRGMGNLTMTLEDLEIIDRILGKAEAALAEPPRNEEGGGK